MSYEILDGQQVRSEGSFTWVTIHYIRDDAEKSCVFKYPERMQIREDPRVFLKRELDKGNDPRTVTYEPAGSFWVDRYPRSA